MKEIVVPVYVQTAPLAPTPRLVRPRESPPLPGQADDELLGYGVPPNGWTT